MSEGEQDRGTGAPGTSVVASPGAGDVGVAPARGGPSDRPAEDRAGSPSRPEQREGPPPARDAGARRRGPSVLMLLLMLVLAGAAVAGAGAAVWAYRGEGRARKAEREAVDKEKKAEQVANEYKGKFRQSESTWKAAVKELHHAQEAAEDARRARDEMLSILDFFKKTLLSAGRPGDGSLEAAFWAGGQGNDVTLRKSLDSTEARVAGTFDDHPLAEAAIREMLGLGYLNVGEPARAVQQYERALALREATQGAAHPEAAACRNQLAVAYRLANRTTEAARLFERNPNTAIHAAALAARAAILLREKKPAEAELRLRESLTILRKIQPGDWKTFDTESALGEALLDQRKYDDAEKMLVSGYEGMLRGADAIPAGDKSHLTEAIERLVRLYEAWGKPEKAATWRQELTAAAARAKP